MKIILQRISLLYASCFFSSVIGAAPIQEHLYQVGKIYTIYTGAGIATQIEIDPKEQVKDFGTGFSNGWDLVRRENIFYLKPKDLESETNMYIRTDKRVYLFDLKIASKNWKRLEEAKAAGVNYRVNFVYPTEVSITEAPSKQKRIPSVKTAEAGKASPQITGYENYYTKYDVSANNDSAWLIPNNVYDDGNFTYIRFGSTNSFPSVYGRKKDNKSEFLINTTVENNVLIVHGTHPYLVLRHGNNVVGLRRN